MAELKAEIKVTGIQPFEDLIEVMAANYDALPDAVKDALLQIDGDPSVYDSDYIQSLIGDRECDGGLRCYVDGVITTGIESGHRIGKRIAYALLPDESGRGCRIKQGHTAESFWVTHGSEYICGWGEKPSLGGE